MPNATETLTIAIEARYRGQQAVQQAADDIARLSTAANTSARDVQDAAQTLQNALGGFNMQSTVQDLHGLAGDLDSTLNKSLAQTADSAQSAAAGVAAFGTKAAIAAGIVAGLALVTAKFANEFGNYGQIVMQTERRFTAFTGSSARATAALRAMQEATEYGLSAMDAMQTTSLLLSMGLADTGEKAAEIARAAVMLGPAWRGATENIRDFTMLLGNQSVRRLDQFGLSISEVKSRQKELMELGLASDLAFTNSVLEASEKRMKALASAGVVAATGAQQLQSAWADLRKEISKPFAGPVSDIESWLAKQIRDLLNPKSPIENARDMLIRAKRDEVANLTSLMSRRQPGDWAMEALIEQSAQRVRRLNDEINLLSVAFDNATDSARQLPDILERIGAIQIAPMHINLDFSLSDKTAKTYAYLPDMEFTEGQYGFQHGKPIVDPLSPTKRFLAAAQEIEKSWKSAATHTADAFDSTASIVAAKFGQAINFSVGLRDFRVGGAGGLLTPGVNGPFEDIYRLQAWLTDNSWGNIAAKYGIVSKEQGTEIVRRFQTGLWDDSVTRMIDVSALEKMVLTEKQAEAFKRAFAERIANATGAGTDVVAAMIWGSEYTDTQAQTNTMTQTSASMVGGIINGLAKARSDLERAGYEAAMAYRVGWLVGSSDFVPPSQPDNGYSYNEKRRELGIE